MKQGMGAALLVVVVVVALGLGFFGGQLWKGGAVPGSGASADLEKLAKRVETLEQSPARGSGGFRIAYVDMFKVLQEMRESDLVKTSLEQYRGEEEKIKQQEEELRKKFDKGEISKKQLDDKMAELNLQLQQINLQLSAPIQKQMLEIIQQLGQEKGYGIIIDNPASQLNAIVLYSQAGNADDITQEVITRFSAQLKQNESK